MQQIGRKQSYSSKQSAPRFLLSILIVLLAAIAPAGGKAQSSKPLLTAVYSKQIKAQLPFPIRLMPPKTANDSMLAAVSKELFKQMEKEGIAMNFIDSITVYTTRSVLHSVYDEDGGQPGLTMNMNVNGGLVTLENNRFYTTDRSGKRTSQPDSSYKIFTATGKTETILGYDTKIYVSADGTETIWATDKLPALLNPLVSIRNPVGGILKYESRGERQVLVTTIQQLIK